MSECSRWFRQVIHIAFFLIAGGFPQAHAQLRPCAASGSGGEYKIYVDDVRVVGGSTTADPKLVERVEALRDFLTPYLRSLSQGKAFPKPCKPRFPSDQSEFDDIEIGGLFNQRVLLEVWGFVDDPSSGSGALGVVLVPAHKLAPPAVYLVKIDLNQDLLKRIRDGAEMRAYVPLVLGMRAYQNLKYAEAVPALCEGSAQLADVIAAPASAADPALRNQQQQLLARLKTIIDDAIRKGRSEGDGFLPTTNASSDGTFGCPQ